MRSTNRRSGVILVAAVLLAAATCSPALVAAQTSKEVPGPERVSPAVINYSRVTPQIAAAGLLRGNAVAELKSLGFAVIVDLRGPAEGTGVEQRAASEVAIRYANIPVTTDVPTDAQIVEFARLVEDTGNYPIMIHCGSANRVGAMWALYRAARGAPFDAALAEGRTIGMQPAREKAVRERLARPPFTK